MADFNQFKSYNALDIIDGIHNISTDPNGVVDFEKFYNTLDQVPKEGNLNKVISELEINYTKSETKLVDETVELRDVAAKVSASPFLTINKQTMAHDAIVRSIGALETAFTDHLKDGVALCVSTGVDRDVTSEYIIRQIDLTQRSLGRAVDGFKGTALETSIPQIAELRARIYSLEDGANRLAAPAQKGQPKIEEVTQIRTRPRF